MPKSSSSPYPDSTAPRSLILKEQGLEDHLIGRLQGLKYEYRPDIRDRAALEQNFREKFEALNRVRLTDSEFARLLDEIVTQDVFAASKTLRTINSFVRDDGTPLNYTLVNIRDWCKNTYEVVNQLRINTDHSHHRYDLILLINGVPVVQIELKTLGISARRAMEQIVDYKNDPGNGYTRTLLCFLQLFIVSNRDRTVYFSNNDTRHFAFNADERFLPVYEFADESNRKITHLDDFAASFLKKCDLGRTISRYMVLLAGEQKLMIMRPYQVYAVQHLVKCIEEDNGNGFIWHTTGSGKTLTSFKASTLLKENDLLHKCVFVVDRKDLDRQTREEFNRFQEGFLLYQLSAFQSRIPINETGIGAGKIELDHLKGFELFIPEAPEQQRIASCLTSLDDLIAAQTQKHEALKTHKKGLMQQLFPSPEEAIGS